MATKRVPILGVNTIPDTGGDVFFEPLSVKATNDKWQHLVVIFNDTATKIGLRGSFNIPKDYVSTTNPNIVIVWTSTATAGAVTWECQTRPVGGNDTESLDQATAVDTANGGDAAPGTGLNRLEFSLGLTAASYAADDICQFELFRDGTDAGDTMAAAAILVDLLFEYQDV